MPTSARKSSLGASHRGPLKAHIPFRGDNPEVGKRTGYAVQLVERKSDGFEPFEDIIKQADKRTPPKMKTGGNKKVISSPADDDGGGEMSMDMDDSNPNSPMEFFTNSRLPAVSLGVNRVGSSSRRQSRPLGVDFDKVPSPRPRSSQSTSKRQSMANGSGPGPSNLSKSTIAPSPEEEPPDDSGIGGDFDDYGAQELTPTQPSSTQQISFTQLSRSGDDDQGHDQDEDEDEDEDRQETPVPKSKKSKGKEPQKRPQTPDRDEDVEDEIAQGLQDVELGQHSDGGEEEPPTKRSRTQSEKSKRVPRTQNQKRRSSLPEGVRRGKRLRYGPLEWWRQEKVVYGRRDSGITLVPHIKEILRVPKDEVVPLSKPPKRKRASTRSKSEPEEKEIVVYNPEEGWDDKTDQQGIVIDFITKEEVQRRIAFTAKMVDPKAAANSEWFFQKVFGDGDFIAAGQLIIPPKSRKPSKGTKDNTYVFYVIEGAVNLKVHETSLILATGGMFMVPRGNTYFIENISDRDAKLFFTQARKIAVGEDEATGQFIQPGPRLSTDSQRRASGGRSSSLGAAPITATASPAKVNGTKVAAAAKRAASTRL